MNRHRWRQDAEYAASCSLEPGRGLSKHIICLISLSKGKSPFSHQRALHIPFNCRPRIFHEVEKMQLKTSREYIFSPTPLKLHYHGEDILPSHLITRWENLNSANVLQILYFQMSRMASLSFVNQKMNFSQAPCNARTTQEVFSYVGQQERGICDGLLPWM